MTILSNCNKSVFTAEFWVNILGFLFNADRLEFMNIHFFHAFWYYVSINTH